MTQTLIARVSRLRRMAERTQTRLQQTQNTRLLVAGIFFASLLVSALQPKWRIELVSIPLFVVVFSWLVAKSRRLNRFTRRLRLLADFYERQQRRREGRAVERDWQNALEALSVNAAGESMGSKTGSMTVNPSTVNPSLDAGALHDLNLIGAHSLFTLLDETVSDGGRRTLAEWIVRPALEADGVRERQRQIDALRRERWFFIRLLMEANESEWSLSTQQTLEFLKKPFLEPKLKRLVGITCAAWVICVLGLIFSLTTDALPPTLFVMAFIVTGLYATNSIGPVFLRGVGLAHHLSALVPLFTRLEKRLENPELKALLPAVDRSRPSKQLRRFNAVLAFLSTESHPLIYLILNAVSPWSSVFVWLLERERESLSSSFPEALREFNALEALISLVFLREYQTDVFPSLANEPCLSVKGVFHPLIDRRSVVANDFTFPNGRSLGLLTGSNMSGKSTFLRTIGINQTLANLGAPVFAESFTTCVFKIGSCIQVSDSLRDGFSYFYSEVLRLKALIDDVSRGESVLFLVDEIFRGTNNRERHIGSRAVIRSLAGPRSLGFVSTHDLELTQLEEELPRVLNLHFREGFENGEMTFSYRLQTGPCPTTNALKIMERAGLDVKAEGV